MKNEVMILFIISDFLFSSFKIFVSLLSYDELIDFVLVMKSKIFPCEISIASLLT